MKHVRHILIFTVLLLLRPSCVKAQQYQWVQKSNFGGGPRYAPFAFAIGNKGYIGSGITSTGSSLQYIFTDFWEYDAIIDTWTQKANLPGTCRNASIGFTIGLKGYVTLGWSSPGVGMSSTFEYDPALNLWTQKSNFGGSARYAACSFTIGNNAYIGTGYAPYKNDFWKYDPALDSWAQIANIGGPGRSEARGFSIGGLGYVFGGGQQFNYYTNDLWQYDPVSNSWTQKTNCPGAPRCAGTAFTMGGYGFVGTGCTNTSHYMDFYRYDPIADSWLQIADFGGGTRVDPVAFTIANNGYVGVGSDSIYPSLHPMSDFWVLEDVTGMNEKNKIDFSIYPNPAVNYLTVVVPTEKSFSIEIYDVKGKCIYKTKELSKQVKVDVSKFAKGSYTLSLISTTRKRSTVFVKN